ncbi:MAG: NAD(P)H-hydrate dehydratase [Lentisphaerae bacterium]|jgi:hydroxyethylthiazole kinase-like uncharacterized protein yjeF|nr:NAD(P)H-hydrate dehydratase [Lentisphaerota bacterium]
MRYVSTDEMREIDSDTIVTSYPFPNVPRDDALMKLASLGLSNFILRMCTFSGVKPSVYIIFGPGNNGGDAVYAGLELSNHGFRVHYYAAFERSRLRGSLAALEADGKLAKTVWQDDSPWTDMPAPAIEQGAIIIDGILGIGAKGAPSGITEKAIKWINAVSQRGTVVSVDVPSGLDADTGESAGAVVKADCTVCMGMPKKGMSSDNALSCSGSVYFADLKIAPDLLAGTDCVVHDEMVTGHDVAESVPCRKWNAHKGDLGHVCIIGGAPGYCGAPSLAAIGAMRAGAGLTSVYVPHEIANAVASQAAEMMVWQLNGWCGIRNMDFKGKTLVAGPGMGRSDEAADAVKWLLDESGADTIVLDADGLNTFSDNIAFLSEVKSKLILTPHPGEAARLLGISVGEVQSDRVAALKKLISLTGATVILKGAGTLVSAPDKGVHLIPIVNPGMASGGMGDVLAGIAGALLARGMTAFDSARAAAWIHGHAGDIASWRLGEDGLLATDVANSIGDAMRYLA